MLFRSKRVVLCEDVISTFGTTRRSLEALREKTKLVQGAEIARIVLCIVNHTGATMVDGYTIVSLIETNAKSWELGYNPYTQGPERVAPLYGKQQWAELTREYPAAA